MRLIFFIISLLVLAGLSLSRAFCQTVPDLINYQGRLTDQNGTPLGGGVYGIQFRLWDSPSATNTSDLIWGQQQNVTVQTNGVFNVILGASGGTQFSGITSGITDLTYAFGTTNRYIGTTLVVQNGAQLFSPSEILPRQQILSVPFAIQANTAQTVLTSPIPRGIVTMWSGTIATIPSGWALCNGANGTPDLRNHFILCADADSAGVAMSTYTGTATQSGGSVHHTHTGKTGYSADQYNPNNNGVSLYPNDWDSNPQIDHDHHFTTDNENVVPVVYYALAYIMKL